MAGGNNVARMSPRQRMINLMYIVLTAMLALNVSSDVLNGFSQVQDGIQGTNLNITARNGVQFAHLENLYEQNPEKAGRWYQQGVELHKRSDKLYALIEDLKTSIAKAADGADGKYSDIVNNDDLEASAVTMLNPATNKGQALRRNLDEYRKYVVTMIPDAEKRKAVENMLSTKVSARSGDVGSQSWEQKMFENMPAVAAVTLLTKVQNDIRQAESEALSGLIAAVDMGDVRVNELNAYVIPVSNMIMRGGKYSADIVLAAIDTTQRPEIFINGSKLDNAKGHYEFVAGSVGTHDLSLIHI